MFLAQISQSTRAILVAILGFSLWVCGDTIMKIAGESSIPRYEIMVLAAVGGMAFLPIILAFRGQLATLKPRHPKGLLVLCFLYAGTFACWQAALVNLPMTSFYTVIFMAPTLVSILASILFREKFSFKKIGAAVVGFIGVVIAINPAAPQFLESAAFGYLAVFVGMLMMVVQMLLLRFMGSRESRESITFYQRFGGVFAGLGAMLLWGFVMPSFTVIWESVLIGCFGCLGWLCISQAYKMAPAATIAPFHYVQIIMAAVLGYLIWGDVPSWHLWTGASFIIASGLYILWLSHCNENNATATSMLESEA